MNNKKNTALTGIIYLVVFVAYNLLVFLVFNKHNNIFWISYGFMLAAYALHIVCVYFISKNLSVKTLFFGIPLLSFSLYFVCAQLFCSLVFMIFQGVVSVKVAVLIQALLLCLFIVIAVISIMTRDTVQNVDNKIRENVSFIKGINVDLELLMERSKAADVTMELRKLSETVKYSDPMSNASVALQEQLIMQNMAGLRAAFDGGQNEQVKELCNTLNLLFIERNKKIMISK